MGLNFGLLKETASFDDNGKLSTSDIGRLHETAKKTTTGTITSGSTIHTYDFDDTTSLAFSNTGSTTFNQGITYDFFTVLHIRSVEAYADCWNTGGPSSKPIIEYSTDNTNWTEAASGTLTGVEGTKDNLTGGDFRARYVRIGGKSDGSGGTQELRIYEVRIRG